MCSTLVILIIVFTLTACGKSSDSENSTYSISGTATMDDNALQGVAVTLSGASSANATTDDTGNYTFENLPAGTYTVTPSLAGYNYSPSNPAVTITNTNKTQNFTAASAVTSYSRSGTISYDGGGRVDVGLKNSDGSAAGMEPALRHQAPLQSVEYLREHIINLAQSSIFAQPELRCETMKTKCAEKTINPIYGIDLLIDKCYNL